MVGTLLGGILLACLAGPPAWAERDPHVPLWRFTQDEVSGLAASRRYPGVCWAIQDSGPGQRAVLLAFREQAGRLVAWPDGSRVRSVPVAGAPNRDWEEVAADASGNLWIADSGNNDEDRTDLSLWRVPEPDPYRARQATASLRVPFRYPDAPPWGRSFDAEALWFWQGEAYVITKTAGHGLYHFPALDGSPVTLTRLGALTPPARGFEGLVTGAAIASDGTRLAVAAGRRRLYVYESALAPTTPAAMAAVVAQPPRWSCPYASDQRAWQVEAVTFRPGSHDLWCAAEEGPLWCFPASFYAR
ncbi:MAG: hypothetical protein VKP62_14540 [Candidatus Sericytochromatia bacterium]|nr:hypothetical protein [Candidatus Sericytochromatia bacterium]